MICWGRSLMPSNTGTTAHRWNRTDWNKNESSTEQISGNSCFICMCRAVVRWLGAFEAGKSRQTRRAGGQQQRARFVAPAAGFDYQRLGQNENENVSVLTIKRV